MTRSRLPFGWTLMRFTVPEPEKLMTRLAGEGVPFREAAPPEAVSFTARVPARCAARAEELARRAGGEAHSLRRRGLPGKRKALRRALPAALLLALGLLLLWGQGRIWDIEFSGNETIPDAALRQALAECGVDIGERWVGMSQDTVRNGVILRLPEIRWMTVTMQGSRAHVIVREKRQAPAVIDERAYADIRADRAGLVTAVYALRGTAEVRAGEAVLPGETIVGGYATGRFGVQGPVRAEGWAEASTWVELTASAPSALRQKVPAGEGKTRWSLVFGRTRINFCKGSSICPADCDKIIERYDLAIPGVFTLPLALERETLRPCDTVSVRAEELPEELEAALRAELSRRLGETGELVSASAAVWEADGMTYVTLAAECRERIGVSAPLTDEDLAAIDAKIPKTED